MAEAVTVADNVRSLAKLTTEVKREFKLSETSVLRIIDMSFALAQAERGQYTPPPEFEDAEDAEVPSGEAEGQLTLFPNAIDPAAIAAADEEAASETEEV